MTLIGPLFWYELRRLPRRRMHLWRILYAAALLLGLVVVYLRSFRDRSAFEALTDPGPLDLAGNAAFAETYLMAFLAVQQLAVIALTPLYAAGSIADEKERRTFDFLLSSPLPHYQILLGKLLARLVYVGSILAVGLPVLMLTFLFGGVDFEHLLAGFAVAVVSAIFLGSLGVMLASQKNSLRETLPGLATALLAPACLGLCGLCKSILAAASPITVLPILFGHWHVGKSTGDDTWFTVGVFAAVHLSLSLLLVIAAKAALRDQSAPEARPVELPVPPAPAIHPPPEVRRWYTVPGLGDGEDPLLWKEKHLHLPWFAAERGCAHLGLMFVVAGAIFLIVFGVFVLLAIALSNRQPLHPIALFLAEFVCVPAAALLPAFLGARVAMSLGRERGAQTLVALFTLPVDRVEILSAIVRGLLYRDRWLLGAIAFVLLFSTVTGGVDIRASFAAAVLLVGCGAWALAFGLWLSVHVELPTRASLIFLATWGAVLLLPWFVAPFVGPDWREMIEMICPPYGMLEALQTADVRVALVTGIGMSALAGLFASRAAHAFEREGK